MRPFLRDRAVGTLNSYPLNGLTPTGAYSMGRPLFTTYTGSLFALTSGNISTWLAQVGTNFNDSGTASRRPVPTTDGPKGRACAMFNNGVTTHGLQAGVVGTLGTFISNSAGFAIISVIFDAFTLNQSQSFGNDLLLSDTGEFFGLFTRSGGIAYGYNWDGNEDAATGTIAIGVPYVLTWRHEGGNVFLGVYGRDQAGLYGAQSSAASGNTQTLTNPVCIGLRTSNGLQPFKGKVFELAIFNTALTARQRAALISDFGVWIGALGGPIATARDSGAEW